MNTEILEKIGMTKGEIRVYLSLLDLGSSATGNIINKSGITSSKVYLILERLEQKGLVSHVMKNNVKYFQSADPKRLLDYLEEKKKELTAETESIQNILPELSKRRKLLTEIQETTSYQGYKGIETAMVDFIDGLRSGDEYLLLGAKDLIEEKYLRTVRKFHMRRAELGIRVRLVYNSKQKNMVAVYRGISKTEIRFVETVTPSSIAISKSKILILSYGQEPRAVLIQNKQIAESFWDFFESMWLISKAA